MKKEYTDRGFGIIHFTDANNNICSLQESSAIRDESLIWLGQEGIDRMHLTQSQVRELLPQLEYFAEHGILNNKQGT